MFLRAIQNDQCFKMLIFLKKKFLNHPTLLLQILIFKILTDYLIISKTLSENKVMSQTNQMFSINFLPSQEFWSAFFLASTMQLF